MKHCPVCNRRFDEESISFCTEDGIALIEDVSAGTRVSSKTPEAEWQPPPPPTYAQPENKGLATASMVTGITSTVCLGPLPGIVAIILGCVALSQIKRYPERVGGRQFAWVGIATGSLGLVLYGSIIILYIVMVVLAASSR